MLGPMSFTAKVSNVLMAFGTLTAIVFSHGMRLRLSSNFPQRRMRLACATAKMIDKWRRLLEKDPKVIHQGQWVGFYCDGADNHAFILQCVEDFIPSRRQQYHLSMPLIVKCFTVGTHSKCLSEWWWPTWNFTGFFNHVKIMYATKGAQEG